MTESEREVKVYGMQIEWCGVIWESQMQCDSGLKKSVAALALLGILFETQTAPYMVLSAVLVVAAQCGS